MADLYLPQASDWINAFEAGQKSGAADRKTAAISRVGGLMASGDYKGAAAAIYPYDLEGGVALTKYADADADRRRKLERQRVVEEKVAVGDLAGAYAAAGSDEELLGGLAKITAHATETTEAMAGALQALKDPNGHWLPPEVARQKYQAMKPTLLQRGLSQQKLDAFDPTPENLDGIQGQVLGLAKTLELAQPKVVGNALVRPDGKELYKGERYLTVPQGGTVYAIGGDGQQPGGSGQAPAAPAAGGLNPRGLRNNNPLNVSALANGQKWNGQTGVDGQYATFATPEDGWRAADRNLQTYATRHGINTLSGVISRWAPPGSNDTANYISTVAGKLGVDPNAQLNLADPGVRRQVLEAMAHVEVGQPVGYGQGGAPAASPEGEAPPGMRVVARGQPKPMARAATAEEKKAYGLDPDVPAQITPDGKIDVISDGRPSAKEQRVSSIQLRKEFDAHPDVKAFGDVASSYDIISGIASGPPTAANDISMIFAYMKMLDPGSVVREGEFATAQNAAGIPQQIQNLYNRALNGQRLNPDQRKQFTDTAAGIYRSRKARYDQLVTQYQGYAQEMGLPDTTIQPRLGAGPEEPHKPAGWTKDLSPAQRETVKRFTKRTNDPVGAQANPYVPVTESEFNRLPVGAWFINPADGRILRKTH